MSCSADDNVWLTQYLSEDKTHSGASFEEKPVSIINNILKQNFALSLLLNSYSSFFFKAGILEGSKQTVLFSESTQKHHK